MLNPISSTWGFRGVLPLREAGQAEGAPGWVRVEGSLGEGGDPTSAGVPRPYAEVQSPENRCHQGLDGLQRYGTFWGEM